MPAAIGVGGRTGQRSTADAKVCSWRRNAKHYHGRVLWCKGRGVGRSAIIRKAALATFRADYPRSTKASKLLQNSCTTGVSTEGRAGRGGGCCPLTSQQVTARRFGDLFNILLQFASASKFIIGSIRVCRASSFTCCA